MEQLCYRYDGTFDGFLCCVFESYVNKEEPAAFLLTADPAVTLWPERQVETDQAHARRVWKGLGGATSLEFVKLVDRAFLTCLEDKERLLYGLIRRGFAEGDRVRQDLADPDMAKVDLALRKMWTEWDHLKGFVRFSELEGMLVGEIEPKNRVLPLLAPHFAGRFNTERVALYDRTHREAFFYAGGRWTILPVEEFQMGPAGAEEQSWRRLWRRFFQTIAIEGRINPKCQSTHLPKRYRHVMTEFMEEEPGPGTLSHDGLLAPPASLPPG